MDNRRTMESSSINRLVGRPEKRVGIYLTAEAGNTAGSTRAVQTVEEREELESRGINPDWDRQLFRKNLTKIARQNGVLFEQTYLDDKIQIHDKKIQGTSENDVYLNPDGKTLTKLNDFTYVKSGEPYENLSAFLDRLEAHNNLFPEVAYNVQGFVLNNKSNISLVIEQPFVLAECNASQEEIDNYLSKYVFERSNRRVWSNNHFVWSNGKYELFDARPANVLKGKDGQLYFIDTFIHSTQYFDNLKIQTT